MKVNLRNKHSPCLTCYSKGILYDENSEHCQSCEYNIAVQLLKRVLKENDYCDFCKSRASLGGGYYTCAAGYDDKGTCRLGENYNIDWQKVCEAYGIETT